MTEKGSLLMSVASGLAPFSTSLLVGCASCFGAAPSDTATHWGPMPLQAAHIEGDTVVAARAQTVEYRTARYVVKVRDGEAEALSRLYFRDREAAKASFETWAADKPLFRSMALVGCTYGGELVLQPEAGDADTGPSGDLLLEALRAHPLVAYADPDYVAQAEGGN